MSDGVPFNRVVNAQELQQLMVTSEGLKTSILQCQNDHKALKKKMKELKESQETVVSTGLSVAVAINKYLFC